MPETIHGTVERVYFASPTFSAGVIDAGSGVKVKFSGKFHVAEGEPITVVGEWQKHQKYGYQFAASGLTYDLPETQEGLERYLAKSKAFRGIGEATAAKLVEYAGTGERLDNLIRNGIEELRAALRIPVATLQTLQAQWIAHAAENKVRTYLSAFDLSPHQIDMLLSRFGEGIVGVLKADPYMLIRHVHGYGFKRIDDIARKTGVAKDHPGRIKAGLLHTAHESIDAGHTWIDGGELVRTANDLLLMDELDSLDRIKAAGRELLDSGELVGEDAAVSLPYIWEAEKVVAEAFAMARMLPAVEPLPGVQIPSDLNPVQRTAFSAALRERISAISGGAGTGKAQPLDAKILTPSGWQCMGDMQVGSLVIGANGLPCKVTRVHPQGQLEVYQVTFTDGTATQCCADHLWHTRSQKDRDRSRPGSVKSLREIMKAGLLRGKKREHWIPMVKPVEFANRDVPLDPYALGLILGDGCLTAPSTCGFSNPSEEIISMLNSALPEHMRINQAMGSCKDYRLCGSKHGHNPLLVIMRELGLQGAASADKHIPDSYKYSSSGMRLALLQGLLDTDGYACGSTLEYVSVSRRLADDVRFLVQSLGGTCALAAKEPTYTYNGSRRIGQTAYRLHICLPGYVWPFRLPRKSAAYSPRTKYQPRRAIESINPIGMKNCQCISVDAADHLYVTDDFIVTHNTYIVGKLAGAWQAAGRNICLCAPTGKAAKRIEEVLRTKHGITDIEARTIHRVLGYDGQAFHTERVDADVIVIDEFSMVDVLLCAELFKRVDLSRTRIVLVGDHNQLPPVGPGNILRDIMAHDLVPNTVLDTVVRNAGPIERAAQQILAGTVPPSNAQEPQWAVVDSFKEPEAIRSYLRELVLDMIPQHLGYDPVRDVQIVTPVHKGPLGTKSVNDMMQYLIHGDVRGRFAIGDKVIQTVNDYNIEIMNGHQGIVTDISKDSMTVLFDGDEERDIASDQMNNIKLAYALTAHKCVAADTLIPTSNGLIRMDELSSNIGIGHSSPREIELSTRDGVESTASAYNGGIKPIIHATTRAGFQIKGSHEHPVLVANEKGMSWKRMPELEVGDVLVLRKDTLDVQHESEVQVVSAGPQSVRITDEAGWLLGVLVGDGNYTDQKDYRVEVTKGSRDLMLRYISGMQKAFGVRTTVRPIKQGKRYGAYFHSKPVRELLARCGLDYSRAAEKSIPQIILKSPPSVQTMFLQGLFDTDGGFNGSCVHYTTASERLAREVHLMLLHHGVLSKKYSLMEPAPEKGWSGAWRIAVYGTHEMRAFQKRIGFSDEYKEGLLAIGIGMASDTDYKSNWGAIPFGQNLVREFREELRARGGRNYPEAPVIGSLLSRICQGTASLNHLHLEHFLQVVPDAASIGSAGESIASLNRMGFFFDPITELSHGKAQVYDLDVPGSHSFVGNGIVNHNSQGSEFPCVVVLCHKSHFFADRNWIYTSITRAANHVIVLGDRWGLRNAAKKNDVRTRRTLLSLWAPSSTLAGQSV